MATKKHFRCLITALSLPVLATGCPGADVGIDEAAIGSSQASVTEVSHTPVERQSIGNCWLYAAASWVESLNLSYQQARPGGGGGGPAHTCAHLFCEQGDKLAAGCMPAETAHATCLAKICQEDAYCCQNSWDNVCVGYVAQGRKCQATLCAAPATGGGGGGPVEPLDVSQSYWTYWHWFDQVTGYMWKNEISTGGSTWVSNSIILDRGLMKEADFVPQDGPGEMSQTQSSALSAINAALKEGGELASAEARGNRELVRKVFDQAWGLSETVRAQLDSAFGKDGALKLRSGASLAGTQIIDPASLPVRYAKAKAGQVSQVDSNLRDAIRDWRTVSYPGDKAERRQTLIRVQRALHARQPVGVTWNVDFNALENGQNERRGSFNLQTLRDAGGPGRQGGHMTVLNDYEAVTATQDVLKAGVTLDPKVPEQAAKLEAALSPATEIKLLRTKNSWGGARPDRAFAAGFPGYHDLWMDYLNGPLAWCPDNHSSCTDEQQGLDEMLMPPGF